MFAVLQCILLPWPPFYQSAAIIGQFQLGKNSPENCKCGSFSLSISRHNWTVLRDLRVEHVARNEHYLVMDADRRLTQRGCQTSVKYIEKKFGVFLGT